MLREAKKYGFCDKYIARLWNTDELSVYDFRRKSRHLPGLQNDRHLRQRV
jgi:hypothetical protein